MTAGRGQVRWRKRGVRVCQGVKSGGGVKLRSLNLKNGMNVGRFNDRTSGMLLQGLTWGCPENAHAHTPFTQTFKLSF